MFADIAVSSLLLQSCSCSKHYRLWLPITTFKPREMGCVSCRSEIPVWERKTLHIESVKRKWKCLLGCKLFLLLRLDLVSVLRWSWFWLVVYVRWTLGKFPINVMLSFVFFSWGGRMWPVITIVGEIHCPPKSRSSSSTYIHLLSVTN